MTTTVTYTIKPEDYQFSVDELNALFASIKLVVDGKLDVRGDTVTGNAGFLKGVFNLPEEAPAGALRRRSDELLVPEPQAITVVETNSTHSSSTTTRTLTMGSGAQVGDTLLCLIYHTSRLSVIPTGSQMLVDGAQGEDYDSGQPYITVISYPFTATGSVVQTATQVDTGKMAMAGILLRGGTLLLDGLDVAGSTRRGSAATFTHPLATNVGGPGIAISALGCSLTNSTSNLHSAGWTSVTSTGTYNPAMFSVAYRMVADGEEVTGTCQHNASATTHIGTSLIVRFNCVQAQESFTHPELELLTISQANVTTAVSENFRRIYAALNYKVPLAGPVVLQGNWSFNNRYGLDPTLFEDYGPTSAGDPND